MINLLYLINNLLYLINKLVIFKKMETNMLSCVLKGTHSEARSLFDKMIQQKKIKYFCFGDYDAKKFDEQIKKKYFIEDKENPDIIIIVYHRLNRDCSYQNQYYLDVKNKFNNPPKWIYVISTGFNEEQICDMQIHNSSIKGRLIQSLDYFFGAEDYKIENRELLFVGDESLPIYQMTLSQFIDHMTIQYICEKWEELEISTFISKESIEPKMDHNNICSDLDKIKEFKDFLSDSRVKNINGVGTLLESLDKKEKNIRNHDSLMFSFISCSEDIKNKYLYNISEPLKEKYIELLINSYKKIDEISENDRKIFFEKLHEIWDWKLNHITRNNKEVQEYIKKYRKQENRASNNCVVI